MSAVILAGCIAIGAVATMLGVSTKTLRRWDKAGTMQATFRTAGNHRRYDRHDVLAAMQRGQASMAGKSSARTRGVSSPRAAIYSRVSSTRQCLDGELDRQQATIAAHYAEKGYCVSGTYRDVGSGLNEPTFIVRVQNSGKSHLYS